MTGNLSTRRPASIIIFVVLVLCLTLWNGLRLGAAIAFWRVLTEYYAKAGPAYIALSGGFWLVCGLALIYGLWQGKPWAWKAAIGGAAGYTLWYWLDRLFLQQPQANWSFTLATTIILLSFSAILIFPRKTRAFFCRINHDQESENQDSA
jgi:hypothetical protein